MAKKSRSRRRASERNNIATTEVMSPTSSRGNLAEEYHYVVRDLIRIGIIAAILIGGLVILSFFL